MSYSTHDPDSDPLRRWLDEQPERAPQRAVDRAVDVLRETNQPRTIVLRLSIPLAAALAALIVIVAVAGIGLGLSAQRPAAVTGPTPSPSGSGSNGACTLDKPVGGKSPIVLGRGFSPDT